MADTSSSMAPEPPPLGCVIVPVTPFEQNCSVLWCTKTMDGVVIDPGGDLDEVLAAAQKYGVTIKKIWVTHGHMDHCGAALDLSRRLSVPIEGPNEGDAFWLESLDQSGLRYGMAGCKPFTPDRWLHQGDKVTVGEVTFDVYHCPGHTPGHVVFHNPDLHLAWVGDVLFRGSIGRTDFPRGDHDTLIKSITQTLWPLGDDTTFVSGHGPTSTFGEERRSNPFVADKRFG